MMDRTATSKSRGERVKERDLFPPVRDWLRAQGFTVHVELFDADVIGVKDGVLVVVELKPYMTEGLFKQLHDRARWADYVYAAVATTPKSNKMGGWTYWGFGILQVANGRVRERRKARPQPWHRNKSRAYRFKRLSEVLPAADHHVGGLPACAQLKIQNRERCALTPTETP